jgi:hypothetical protein
VLFSKSFLSRNKCVPSNYQGYNENHYRCINNKNNIGNNNVLWPSAKGEDQ